MKLSEQSPAHDAEEPDQHPKLTLTRAKGSRSEMYSNILAVVAIIIAVLVAIALFWWANSGIISSCQTCGPVYLSDPTRGGDPSNYTSAFEVVVGPQSGFENLSGFEAKIMRDHQSLGAHPLTLSAGRLIRFSSNVTLSFTDVEGNGRLTSGDEFFVFGMMGVHEWNFQLIYRPWGSLEGSVFWITPYISRAPVQTGGYGTNQTATFSIAEMSEPIPLSSDFKVHMSENYSALEYSPLTLEVGGLMRFGRNVSVVFTDFGGDGQLNSGDGFLIYGMGRGSWILHFTFGPAEVYITHAYWTTL